jgi:Uncharacterized protein conserved in bacteria (DUF2344)
VPPAEVRTRLGAELPAGLELLGAVDIPRTARSIDDSVSGFRWEVDLRHLPEPPGPAAVRAAVAGFRRGDALPVRKGGKRGDRVVDGRRAVTALEVVAPQRLALEITMGREGTLRPSAVVAALLDLPPDALPALQMHKLATRFHAAPEPAAVAASP